MALAAQRAVVSGGAGTSSAPSEPEQLHLDFLRALLGLPGRTPSAVALAEAGVLLLYVRWLGRAARFWNSVLQQPADSLERRALVASVELAAEQRPRVRPDPWAPWAAQLAAAVGAVGVAFEPVQLQPLCPHALGTAALERHLQRVADATAHGGHTKLQHYASERGCSLTADSNGPAAF